MSIFCLIIEIIDSIFLRTDRCHASCPVTKACLITPISVQYLRIS